MGIGTGDEVVPRRPETHAGKRQGVFGKLCESLARLREVPCGEMQVEDLTRQFRITRILRQEGAQPL